MKSKNKKTLARTGQLADLTHWAYTIGILRKSIPYSLAFQYNMCNSILFPMGATKWHVLHHFAMLVCGGKNRKSILTIITITICYRFVQCEQKKPKWLHGFLRLQPKQLRCSVLMVYDSHLWALWYTAVYYNTLWLFNYFWLLSSGHLLLCWKVN